MAGKQRGLTAEQWTEARKAYEAGESEASLSRRYGTDRKTIRLHRVREQWTPQVTPQVGRAEIKEIHERTKARVIDIGTRQAVEVAVKSGAVDEIADNVASELRNTVLAARIAGEYAVNLLTQAHNGEIEPASMPGEQTVADVFKSMMSGYKLFASTTREIAGLRPGMPSLPSEDDMAIPSIELFGVGPEAASEVG